MERGVGYAVIPLDTTQLAAGSFIEKVKTLLGFKAKGRGVM
jgi:hypothetical protein